MSSSASSSTSSSRNRECIFLDSSDPSTPNKVDSNSLLFIKLPFPPCIDPYKLILDRKESSIDRIPARTPNAFILYRKIFIQSAQKEGYHLPMTVISSMASKSWKRESDIVKEEYKRISKQAFELRNQLYPKSEKKKKREKWNLVSFTRKSNLQDNSITTEMKTTRDSSHQDLDGNFISFNPNLESTNLFPPESSTLDEQNLVLQNWAQVNYTDFSFISQDDKNIELGTNEISHNTNMFVTYTTSSATAAVDSDKLDSDRVLEIPLIQNLHNNFF